MTQLPPLASTWDWYDLAATHLFTSSPCATSSRTTVMTRQLQHPHNAPPCFKAESYRTGGKALNNPGRRFGGWFQSMTLISCLPTFPSAAAWTKPVVKAEMFRARAASPATYAAKAPSASSPPSSPILPNAPRFSFLSHSPENAFFFFLSCF